MGRAGAGPPGAVGGRGGGGEGGGAREGVAGDGRRSPRSFPSSYPLTRFALFNNFIPFISINYIFGTGLGCIGAILEYSSNTKPIQHLYSSNTIPIHPPILFQYCSNAVPIQFPQWSCWLPCLRTVPIILQYCSNTVPTLFHCCSNTVQIQYLYCSNTVPILFQYCSNTFLIQSQYSSLSGLVGCPASGVTAGVTARQTAVWGLFRSDCRRDCRSAFQAINGKRRFVFDHSGGWSGVCCLTT